MATRTYTVGDQSGVRRLDNLTGLWQNVSVNLLDNTNTPINSIFRDVMTDPNDGNKVFVVGERDALNGIPGIYWSSDAGVTWNKAIGDIATSSVNLGSTIFEIWCVDSNTIYATSNYGYCFKSTDGGVTFDHTIGNPDIPVFPAPQGETYSRAIHFTDATNGVLTQDLNGGQLHVMITSDGGINWTKKDLGTTFPNIGLVGGIHISADYLVINIIAEFGILRSTDGGLNFSQVYTVTPVEAGKGNRLLHLTWTDDDNLWVYGTNQIRLRTIDAGVNWTSLLNYLAGGPTHKAGHHYQLPQGFFSEDTDILQTLDESITGILSEAGQFPGGVEAVWTGTPSIIDPPNPQPCGCPEGYTYNPATDECDRILSVSPDCTGNELLVVGITPNAQYGQMGTSFFSSTVGSALPLSPIPAVGGLGGIEDANSIPLTYTNINATTNNFWGNCNPGNPYPLPCVGSAGAGRLNAIGVWSGLGGGDPHNEWIGFTTCVTVPTTGIYFIGIGSDESSRFSIDGVLFTNLAPGSFDEWSVWRVFPVLLTAGQHTIEMEGLNASLAGGFGAEIYKVPNDDVNLLMAVTSELELAPYLIWNTKQIADEGGFFDLGEESGCECPNGYALSNCNGFLECIQIDTIPFLPCGCYLLTNCEDPLDTVLIQTDPLDPPLDLTKTYVFDSIDPDKCWTVAESELCDPANPLPFSVFDETFDTCEDCLKVCYELTDCEGLLDPIQTDTDLSAYVGLVIKIVSCPETCWTVTELLACPVDVEQVVVTTNFPDCVTCLPSDPPPPPLVIRNRKIKPGYDTPGCSPEYVEKISCDWSEALFQKATTRRYGIDFCCAVDLDKFTIKKQLLDLKMITDPDACKTIVDECCPPCGTIVELHVFDTIDCPAPTGTSAILVPPPVVEGKDCRLVVFRATSGPGIDPSIPQTFTGTTCLGAEIIVSLLPGAPSQTECIDVSSPFIKDPNLSAQVIGTC